MQPEARDAACLTDRAEATRKWKVEAMLAAHDLASSLDNRMLLRAVVRAVEVIGEAARRILQFFIARSI